MLLRSGAPVATNVKNPPLKKKRKKKEASLVLPPTTISSLPDDLLLSCLARVSRLYYPTLSLVSKKFRSLISSPEIYEVRSLLGRTESCLSVCLLFPLQTDFFWFTLSRRPDSRKNKKKKKPSDNLLIPTPSHHSPQDLWSVLVSVGSNIYSISPSSSVWILDCRCNTWHEAPKMKLARMHPVVSVIDGKIYVVGGLRDECYNTSNWIEVFDPKTQTWNFVSSPGHVIRSKLIISTTIDGKIYMCNGNKGLAYNPKDSTFEPIQWDMCKAWVCHSHCVVENILFYYNDERVFKWFDTKAKLWRNLKGLEGIMPEIPYDNSVKLVDYGGKIAVFWDVKHVSSSGYENKVIWCAVIAVERRDSEDEIWGTVEWFDVVLTVPAGYKFVHVLATTL